MSDFKLLVAKRMGSRTWRILYSSLILAWPSIAAAKPQTAETVLVPVIDGEWWQVAGEPDLGKYNTNRQEPVDFTVWQAADGTWQLLSCIRRTKYPGGTRLLYRWESKSLTSPDWKPMGIAMTSDNRVGETEGMLQSPFVTRYRGTYVMFYGDGAHIAAAFSQDGKSFQRRLMPNGQTGMFYQGDLNSRTRDPMAIQVSDQFFLYYSANPVAPGEYAKDQRNFMESWAQAHPETWSTYQSEAQKEFPSISPKEALLKYMDKASYRPNADFVRVSTDLVHWSAPKRVAVGGAAGTHANSAECPFVYFEKQSSYYYLFRTHSYGQGYGGNTPETMVYRSKNPKDFGIYSDRYLVGTLPVAAPEIVESQGQLYIAALLPSVKGVQIAKLKFVPKS